MKKCWRTITKFESISIVLETKYAMTAIEYNTKKDEQSC